jgi:hypothetical protein
MPSARDLSCRLIEKETDISRHIEPVPRARMPLMTLTLTDGITMNVTLSPQLEPAIPAVRTATLLKELLSMMPHARKILIVLKALMLPNGALADFAGVHSGGISSFVMTLLVLAFCKIQVLFVP